MTRIAEIDLSGVALGGRKLSMIKATLKESLEIIEEGKEIVVDYLNEISNNNITIDDSLAITKYILWERPFPSMISKDFMKILEADIDSLLFNYAVMKEDRKQRIESAGKIQALTILEVFAKGESQLVDWSVVHKRMRNGE